MRDARLQMSNRAAFPRQIIFINYLRNLGGLRKIYSLTAHYFSKYRASPGRTSIMLSGKSRRSTRPLMSDNGNFPHRRESAETGLLSPRTKYYPLPRVISRSSPVDSSSVSKIGRA